MSILLWSGFFVQMLGFKIERRSQTQAKILFHIKYALRIF